MTNTLEKDFLVSAIKQFQYYRLLGEQAMVQCSDEALNWLYDPTGNSISTIVKHLAGNMTSRWTDFLHSDGEKPERDREAEFDPTPLTRAELLERWATGWDCLLAALNALEPSDLGQVVYIRNQGHTVMEAISRQLSHYPYHVGQMVLLARQHAGAAWQSLSIPRGDSAAYNAEKFSREKSRGHFTDDHLKA